jgi:hypothetical protein
MNLEFFLWKLNIWLYDMVLPSSNKGVFLKWAVSYDSRSIINNFCMEDYPLEKVLVSYNSNLGLLI